MRPHTKAKRKANHKFNLWFDPKRICAFSPWILPVTSHNALWDVKDNLRAWCSSDHPRHISAASFRRIFVNLAYINSLLGRYQTTIITWQIYVFLCRSLSRWPIRQVSVNPLSAISSIISAIYVSVNHKLGRSTISGECIQINNNLWIYIFILR